MVAVIMGAEMYETVLSCSGNSVGFETMSSFPFVRVTDGQQRKVRLSILRLTWTRDRKRRAHPCMAPRVL